MQGQALWLLSRGWPSCEAEKDLVAGVERVTAQPLSASRLKPAPPLGPPRITGPILGIKPFSHGPVEGGEGPILTAVTSPCFTGLRWM